MRKIVLFTMLLIVFVSSVVTASGNIDSETLLQDMRAHPSNYIYIGGVSSAGDSIYVIKSSVDVQEYAPPKYIISINCGQFWSRYGTRPSSVDAANLWGSSRFLYDYNSRKIYCERKNREGKMEWEYIDPKDDHGGRISGTRIAMAMAELAFYFAYNMSFFDQPVSWPAKAYIEEGRGTFSEP